MNDALICNPVRTATDNGRYALCTMRIGVGRGIAIIIERL